MRSTRRVLWVTGAYAPEFSAGGLQCQAIARVIKERAVVQVLTTATSAAISARDSLEGIPVTRVRVDIGRRWSSLVAFMRLTWALIRILPSVDLVHVQGFSRKNVLLLGMARLYSRPVVMHLQTARHDEPSAIRAQGRLAWWAFTSATRYLAVSQGLADRYLEARLPSDRIAVVPNGVDTGRFRPASADERRALRERLQLRIDKPVVLFVGVMSPDKQPQVLLEAWAELEQQHGFDSTLVFVGATDPRLFELEGRLVEQLRSALATVARRENVVFVPPTAEIENYYRAADVVVMPSIREGLPNVVLEAMASGLPVVASRLAGSTDTMIADGIDGVLVTPGDTHGFAQAIAGLLKDPARAARLGAAAEQTVRERYRIEGVAERWLNAYEQVLGCAEVTATR